MIKKLSVLLVCLSLLLTVGCGGKNKNNTDSSAQSNLTESQSTPLVNNLTGLLDCAADKVNNRPVAIMINNISVAQKVQTGLNFADIVYETEVEGGITRLLAVFKDVSVVEKIGTIRSARYDYIDLAMGHNAIFVHHGLDKTYAAGHLKDADSFEVSTKNGGMRVQNGLATEHTLYANGSKMFESINKKFTTTQENQPMWQNFSTDEIKFSDTANSVSVKFSGAQRTVFKYDAETKEYIRYTKDKEIKDYETGESIRFKNVFVLNTSISNRPDKYHKNISLDSGDGYYVVNGTYTPIKWSKGDASNPFTFTNLDGSALTVNAGSSWVCIADKERSTPKFE